MFDGTRHGYEVKLNPLCGNKPTSKFIQMIPRYSRVLEVGCADGALSAYLTRQLACEVVGIELNPESARHAQPNCSRVIVGDVERGALDQVEGRFDVITFGDVLEHLVVPNEALARCRDLLSGSGFVLVSVPNVAHYSVRFRLIAGRFDYEPYGLLDRTHLRFFTARTARQMLVDSGYQVSAFDIVYAMPGGRLVERCKPIEWVMKRYFVGLIGFQLIFKAAPVPGAKRT